MSKYDLVLKCVQLRKFVEEKKYTKALELIQTIDMNKVASVSDLKVIADVYIKTEQYQDAKEIYMQIYDKLKTRRVLYRLIILLIRSGNLAEAEEFYEDYEILDQNGSDRLILKYRIAKAKGDSHLDLIHILQELKLIDYMEQWGYELAKLYHKEGLIEECISECDDLILWFGEGEFIDKAYRLKQHYESGADQEAFEDMEEALSSEVSKYMMDTNEEQEKAQEETSIDDMIEEGMIKSGDFISLEEFSTMFGKRDEQYHFIIAGEEPKLLNAMVKKLAKLLTQISYFDESKIAKIKPENMHSIIENKKEDKLLGSCVYIENASRLQEDDIKAIKNIIKQHKKDIVFILSDERLECELLLERDQDFSKKFNYRINMQY